MLTVEQENCSSAPHLAGVKYVPYVTDGGAPLDLEISRLSPCLTEASGERVYYIAAALPRIAEPYVLKISAIPGPQTVLAPQAMFLSGTGQVIEEIGFKEFNRRDDRVTALLRPPEGSRFVVVSGASEAVGETIYWVVKTTYTQMIAASPTLFIPVTYDKETADFITYTYGGKLELSAAAIPTTER